MLDIQARSSSSQRRGAVRRRVVEELGRSGQPEAITPLLLAVADESWPVRQAATELLAAFDEAALLPHLEAALRDDEDAAMRNAAMEIYVKMGAAAAARAPRPAGATRTRRSATSPPSCWGPGASGRRCPRSSPPSPIPTSTCATPPRPASARSARAEAVLPLIDVLRTEPWLQYPAIHALGEIGDPRAAARPPGAARRRDAAGAGHGGAGPAGRARGPAPTSCRTSTTPTSPCATSPSTPWCRSSSGPPPPARASIRRCRPPCAARTSSTTCSPPCARTSPRTGARPPSPWAG